MGLLISCFLSLTLWPEQHVQRRESNMLGFNDATKAFLVISFRHVNKSENVVAG